MKNIKVNGHNLSENVYDVLQRVHDRCGGFPKCLVDAMSVSSRATVVNGKATRFRRVKIGNAVALYQYDAAIAKGDSAVRNVRFDAARSFDIPQLANGNAVRYYMNVDIGCRDWDRFIAVVRGLEVTKGQFLPDELESFMRRND